MKPWAGTDRGGEVAQSKTDDLRQRRHSLATGAMGSAFRIDEIAAHSWPHWTRDVELPMRRQHYK